MDEDKGFDEDKENCAPAPTDHEEGADAVGLGEKEDEADDPAAGDLNLVAAAEIEEATDSPTPKPKKRGAPKKATDSAKTKTTSRTRGKKATGTALADNEEEAPADSSKRKGSATGLTKTYKRRRTAGSE